MIVNKFSGGRQVLRYLDPNTRPGFTGNFCNNITAKKKSKSDHKHH
jgi:hypothetical protein